MSVDISKALRRAFNLGQTYCQQADSESYRQNALSDGTLAKFEDLVVETLEAIANETKALDSVKEPRS